MNATDETGSFMATKVTPPIAVAATNLFSGMTVPDIVNYLTLVYLLLMISNKAWHMFKEWKAGKDPDASSE